MSEEHGTGDDIADENLVYVIGILQKTLRSVRSTTAQLEALCAGLAAWRADIEAANLDHGPQIIARIDELLEVKP